jgi:small subunit ribosomal protein S1
MENFADLLDSYSPESVSDIQTGDKIQGKIISIENDTVFVDTHTKMDGIVDKSELLDKNGKMPYAPGDLVELYVVAVREDEIRLSKVLSGMASLAVLKDIFEKSVPVEGKVLETCKGGLWVAVMGRKAFCPASQVDINFAENLEAYVGETYPFLITRLDKGDRNIVVSRRHLLNRELERSRQQFYDELTPAQIMAGKVTKVMPFGVFVELHPGIEGLVHVSELSWSRIEDPHTAVSVGELLQVKVIEIEKQEPPDKVKISLSVKQLGADPWRSADDQFKVGDKIKGVVTRCTKFGAFVEIAPGIEGLVHISEMSYKKRVLKPEDIVRPDEIVFVLVKDMDIANRKIALSIRELEGDPWSDVSETYTVGQRLEGLIEKKEKFTKTEPASLGALGEKLQQALASKKQK